MLSSTGQPDIVMNMPRMGADYEGYFTLVNAVNRAGDRELAADLANWYVDETVTTTIPTGSSKSTWPA